MTNKDILIPGRQVDKFDTLDNNIGCFLRSDKFEYRKPKITLLKKF